MSDAVPRQDHAYRNALVRISDPRRQIAHEAVGLPDRRRHLVLAPEKAVRVVQEIPAVHCDRGEVLGEHCLRRDIHDAHPRTLPYAQQRRVLGEVDAVAGEGDLDTLDAGMKHGGAAVHRRRAHVLHRIIVGKVGAKETGEPWTVREVGAVDSNPLAAVGVDLLGRDALNDGEVHEMEEERVEGGSQQLLFETPDGEPRRPVLGYRPVGESRLHFLGGPYHSLRRHLIPEVHLAPVLPAPKESLAVDRNLLLLDASKRPWEVGPWLDRKEGGVREVLEVEVARRFSVDEALDLHCGITWDPRGHHTRGLLAVVVRVDHRLHKGVAEAAPKPVWGKVPTEHGHLNPALDEGPAGRHGLEFWPPHQDLHLNLCRRGSSGRDQRDQERHCAGGGASAGGGAYRAGVERPDAIWRAGREGASGQLVADDGDGVPRGRQLVRRRAEERLEPQEAVAEEPEAGVPGAPDDRGGADGLQDWRSDRGVQHGVGRRPRRRADESHKEVADVVGALQRHGAPDLFGAHDHGDLGECQAPGVQEG